MGWRGLAVGWIAMCFAGAVSAHAEAQRFQDWSLLKVENTQCLLHHASLSRRSGLTLIEAVITRDDAGPVLAFFVPTGADLAAGIQYRLGAQAAPVSLEWQSCDPRLCRAQVRLNEDQWQAFKAAPSAQAAYVPRPGSPPLQVEMSLRGVTRGWAALNACDG